MLTNLREDSKAVLQANIDLPEGSKARGDRDYTGEIESHPSEAGQGYSSDEDGCNNPSGPIPDITGGRAPGLLETSLEPRLMASKGFRIAIKASNRILLIDSADVIAVEAQASYVILHRKSGSIRARGSISVLARDLEPRGFVRIHRSVIVNKACVLEIRKAASGEYMLRTSDGKEFRVSRSCTHNLKVFAQVWVGKGIYSE